MRESLHGSVPLSPATLAIQSKSPYKSKEGTLYSTITEIEHWIFGMELLMTMELSFQSTTQEMESTSMIVDTDYSLIG